MRIHRPRVLVSIGFSLVAIGIALAALGPAYRDTSDASDNLLAASQLAMTRAQRLDRALLLSGDERQEALKTLRGTTPSAPIGDYIKELEGCLSSSCADESKLALRVKTAVAAEVTRARARLKSSRARTSTRLYLLVGILALGFLVMLLAYLRPSEQPKDKSGELAGSEGTELEDTYRKRLEQLYEVRKHSRENARFAAFGEVAAGLSHGLKTPLACVRAATQVAQAKIGDDHAAQNNLDDVIDEVDGLVDQINRFLKTMGGGEPVLDVLKPQELMAPLDQRYRNGLADKAVNWSMDISDSVQGVRAEPELVEMALRNLIDNAFEASGEGTTVAVSLRHSKAPARVGIDAAPPGEDLVGGDWVEIVVLDQGAGIAPELVKREKIESTRVGGSGLGIAIARRIAARLGGALELEPREGESGTRASFYLPPTPEIQSGGSKHDLSG